MTHTRAAFAIVVLTISCAWPAVGRAQLPDCSGADAVGASREYDAGSALMEQALTEIRGRRAERARAHAAEALAHFDRQCEMGDVGALAERGGALMLMGEALRSAQSYDAFLAYSPLEALDPRSRRRLESNLQPGSAQVSYTRGTAHLFIDDLDFGPLPRSTDVRIPLGEHRFEARGEHGDVVAAATASLTTDAPSAPVELVPVPVQIAIARIDEPTHDVTPVASTAASSSTARQDYTLVYVLAGAATAVGLGLGVGGLVAADDRAQTYNRFCLDGGYGDCDTVLGERDTMLGLAVGGFVLAGLGAIGLVVAVVLDAGQPSNERGQPGERVQVALVPSTNGGTLTLSGGF